MLVHALDGYDEISLTQDTKVLIKWRIRIPYEELGFKNISEDQIYGGETKEEAAAIFLNILDGKGTPEQNALSS